MSSTKKWLNYNHWIKRAHPGPENLATELQSFQTGRKLGTEKFWSQFVDDEIEVQDVRLTQSPVSSCRRLIHGERRTGEKKDREKESKRLWFWRPPSVPQTEVLSLPKHYTLALVFIFDCQLDSVWNQLRDSSWWLCEEISRLASRDIAHHHHQDGHLPLEAAQLLRGPSERQCSMLACFCFLLASASTLWLLLLLLLLFFAIIKTQSLWLSILD